MARVSWASILEYYFLSDKLRITYDLVSNHYHNNIVVTVINVL